MLLSVRIHKEVTVLTMQVLNVATIIGSLCIWVSHGADKGKFISILLS